MHPALAFLQQQTPGARAVGEDTLRLELDGAWVEIFVAPAAGAPVFFAAGATTLSYRCSAGLSPAVKERLRGTLVALRNALAAGRIADPSAALPDGGGWTEPVAASALPAWRDWVVRSYRATVAAGRVDDCRGLPECLDLRMRPPMPAPSVALAAPPRTGPCARCGRVRVCPSAGEAAEGAPAPTPLRHADAAHAELAALRALAAAAALPLADVLESYELLIGACGDRTLAGALPLEFSIRLAAGSSQPDRVRFVSYYPLVASDAVRREINRGRRAAVRTLAARWLTPRERAPLDAWLECTADAQPDTLGLSIGVEMDTAGVRLQVYAHPGPHDEGERLVRAALRRLGGAADDVPAAGAAPVLIGIAVSASAPPALKLYYHRTWEGRGDTGLLPDGLGALAPFDPGWGLAVQEHVDGRAAWVKWDFPVATHYQDYDRFLRAFFARTGDPEAAVPAWLSGEPFSPWPTWASLGRGGAALYFVAR